MILGTLLVSSNTGNEREQDAERCGRTEWMVEQSEDSERLAVDRAVCSSVGLAE